MRKLTFTVSLSNPKPMDKLTAKLTATTLVAVLGFGVSPVWAQSVAPPAAQPAAQPATAARPLPIEAPQNSSPSSANQLIERIQVESRDVRIDEVRFGGETRSITVTPKGGLPAYDVKPSTGERTWKVLGF
jgi:hypothetical protein